MSSNITITNPYPADMEIKRFYPPCDISSTCPQCGETVEYGNNDYLSYPKVNQPTEIRFFHEYTNTEGGYEMHEWSVPCRIEIAITPLISEASPDARQEKSVGWFKVRSDGEGELWALNVPGVGVLLSTRWRRGPAGPAHEAQPIPGVWVTKRRTWSADETEAHYIDVSKPAVPIEI